MVTLEGAPARGRSAGGLFRRLAGAAGAALLLLTGAGPLAPAAAQAQLTPAAIAALEDALGEARSAQAQAADRIACFERRDREMVAQRDRDQLRLGELLAEKRRLEPLRIQRKAEFEAFQAVYEGARWSAQAAENEVRRLQALRDAKERAVAECASTWGTLLCRMGLGLGELFGQIETGDRDLAAKERALAQAEEALTAARDRHAQSEALLDQVEAEVTKTEAEIKRAEATISQLQATLAELRPKTHESRVLLDEFADALREAAALDTSDLRARNARRVQGLAERVRGASRDAGALFDQARRTLDAPTRDVCFR